MITFTTKKPQISINLDDTINITFKAPKFIINEILTLKEDKDYDIKLTNHRTARTLTQNGFLWVLLGELAAKLNMSKESIYKSYIKDYGVYTVIPVKQELADRFIDNWNTNGLGWFCETTNSKINGYINIITYYGSSSYTKEEMARVLDAVIYDCKENGIAITLDYDKMEV